MELADQSPTSSAHRVNRVVISCSRLQVFHAHTEHGFRMARVQPDWRFCCLAKFLGIGTVAHDSIMLVRAPRVVASPPDNGPIVFSRFELWPLRDLDARGFHSRSSYLSGDCVGEEQAAGRSCHRQYQK